MKKTIKLSMFLSALFLCQLSFSQKGTTQLSIGAEADIPTGDFGGDDGFKTGFGGSAKILFGVGRAGQVTFTSGYSSFTAKGSGSNLKVTMGVIPFLLGYRHNMNGLYFEPQLGMAVYDVKASFAGQSGTSSETKFTWAAGLGYAKNGIDLGVRYQSGEFEDGSISLVGLRAAYNFAIGRRSSR